ncbi:MAG: GTPase [Candidatus Aerophobetes bacterium]|nr:GTPase [Candidatus Aerophobetes bacterium]
MPANLPPQYYEIEKKYRLARTNQEKIAILKEMLSIIPKHKGTDRLQGKLKAKISKLNKETEKKQRGGKQTYSHHIPKQGAGQVVLIGAPNTGKSQIISKVTDADAEIAPYPFTTYKPIVGMMPFEDIKIQLIDTPPIAENSTESYVAEIIKSSDLILLIANLGSDDILEEVDTVIKELRRAKILIDSKEKKIEKEKGWSYKNTIMVANKIDIKGGKERFSILREFYEDKLPLISISAKEEENLKKFKEEVYKALQIIRIYTKAPGKPIDKSEPVILKEESNVLDAARFIHKDFVSRLKYARIWSKNKFDGQEVKKDYILKDGDVLEFHT